MVTLPERVRGDLITVTANLTLDGFDWTDVTARCHIRKSIDAPSYLASFSNTGCSLGSTAIFTTSATGLATFIITSSGSVTSSWPAGTQLYGDIEVYRNSPAWGPYTAVQFALPINPDATR